MQKDLPYEIQILLARIAEDDEQAFRAIFEHYKAPFYAIAFKMTRSADIAEEIVQDVFVTLWIKRNLAVTAKKPENYLYAILYNSVYTHFRRIVQEHKLKSKIAQVEDKIENRIETLLLEKENRTILENIISRLPPQQRLIYKLAKQEGVSREEIARQLNISPNTVRNHLATAVNYLRVSLKQNESTITRTIILIYFAIYFSHD
ncbi:MAG: RNA polymerase sigma-70 factor [Bacteroidota bacterium]